MKPAYTIIPALKQNRIEAGEPIHIDVYISGYGPITRNKLYIQQPELLDDSEPGDMTVSVRDGRLEGGIENLDVEFEGAEFIERYVESQPVDDVLPFTGERSLVTQALEQPANRTNLVASFFLDDPSSFNELQQLDERRRSHWYPGIVAEGHYDGHPPIRLELQTRDDAHAGDYTLKVVFTYGDEDEVYQDVQDVTVHVKTARERLEPIPTLARMVAVAIAVTGLGWTVSPYVGTGIFVLILLGVLWYHRAILTLFEGERTTAG